jgi:ethanolamine utilization protein EutA
MAGGDGHHHHHDHHHHDHHHGPEVTERGDPLWRADTLELTTVGLDVGSSTSHLMVSRVVLQRAGTALSSRFVVVDRAVLHRSDVVLTPYRDDGLIDVDGIEALVGKAYADAGIGPADVDTGAVILTGEALRRANAEALARRFAAESGRFVCATAGHHLEAILAAHGSGAVARSRRDRRTHLHVDVGGGTTKLALVRDGAVLATAAVAVGGRLIALDGDRRVVRLEDAGRAAAAATGVAVEVGDRLEEGEEDAIAATMATVLVAAVQGRPLPAPGPAVALTEPLPTSPRPEVVTVSGGVAEYLFGRERRHFGDLAPRLAAHLRRAFHAGLAGLPVEDAGEGIRATVVGASQFTAQVSGSTIELGGEEVLPLRNVPVVRPAVADGEVVDAGAVRRAVDRLAVEDRLPPVVAVAVPFTGPPSHRRLLALARAVLDGTAALPGGSPLVVLLDGDVGMAVGRILRTELGCPRPVVCLDGLALGDLDYVDLGEVLRPAGVVPVVVKSLLFAGAR